LATLDELRLALIELDESRTLEVTRELIANGEATSLSILHTAQQALKVVGERYERQEYFISALIMAGELFKEVLELLEPQPQRSRGEEKMGTVLVGTVAGDIHDIGKNIFCTSLRGFGFNVVDLGVDVPTERFLAEAMARKPAVLGLSGLIMAAFDSMKATVALIRAKEKELGYRLPIILGGAIIDGRVCEYTGADSWSTDAMEGVRICQRLIGR
jgi:methanogenic corrinoid protein MtbC1